MNRIITKIYLGCLIICVFSQTSLGQAGWVIRGKVTDGFTKKALPGVSVVSYLSKTSTLTDSAGYFKLPLQAGEQFVRFSSVGYFSNNQQITYKQTFSDLVIVLQPEIRQLQELIVKEKTPDHNVQSSQMSVVKLDIKNLKNIPVVFGEIDIIKALTLQAGVTTVGEGTSGFNVRGGRTDQNLVLLDGAPIFNTSHLLGFLSNVNAEAVREVTLYKGDIPASYGGRLSSLLSITTKTGNKEGIRMSTGVGLMTASAMADGPLTKNVS